MRIANMRASYFVRSIWAVILAALIWSQAPQVQAAEPLPPEIKLIADYAIDIAGVYSGITGTIDATKVIGDILGVKWPPSYQENQFRLLHEKLDELASKLDTLGRALDWKIDVNNQDMRLHTMLATVDQAGRANKLGMPFMDRDGLLSDIAVRNAGSENQFLRYFVESVTGQKGTGWKAYIKDRPDVNNFNYVYDWRLGVPALMQLMSLRLMIIAAIDPKFTKDMAFRTDLMGYRHALLSQYKKMIDGVRCSRPYVKVPYLDEWSYYLTYTVACADIHVGTYEISDPFDFYAPSYPEPESGPDWQQFANEVLKPMEETLKRRVLLTMPLFQMRSMSDMLYLYANGGSDLTKAKEFIQVAAAPDLCLEVQGGNPTPGTPVQISHCDDGGFAQHWSYDRQIGTIYNPVYDKCLDVQGGNPAPGTPVHIWDCNDTAAQKWTYDPETQVLQSALGTVLDIQWGELQAGTLVWTWERNESSAQRWSSAAKAKFVRDGHGGLNDFGSRL